MYNYWCTNPEHSDKPNFYYGETDDLKICPGCGGDLKLMGQSTNFFAKIGSMTPQQRQQVLLKRSAEHSKKNADIKERREKLHNDVGLTRSK